MPAPVNHPSQLLPLPPLLCLSLGSARCCTVSAAGSSKGLACSKAAVDPRPAATISHYHSRSHYAATFARSASPLPAVTASASASGIVI